MKFLCDQCNAQYMIADEKVGPRGVKVKCKKCAHVIVVKAPEALVPAMTSGGDETRIHDGTAIQAALAAERSKTSAEPIATPQAASVNDADEQARQQAAPASAQPEAAATTKVATKEWFVAIGDAQLGPLDVAEVHSRWDAGDLHEDSLTWRAGMPDWIALSEIPEFTDWTTQRPRAAPEKAEAVAKKGEGLGLAPASGVAWKPSAASALSSLMQEELLAAAAPKPAPVPDRPVGMPDLGNVAKLGAGDLFGANASAPSTAQSSSREEPAGGGAAWSVPAPRKSTPSPAVWALVGGSVLSAVGLGVFVMRNKATDAPVVAQSAPAAAPTPPSGGAPPSSPAAPAQVMTSTPQPQSQLATPAAAAPAAPAAVAPAPRAATAAPDAEAAAHAPASHAKKPHEAHAPRAASPAATAAPGPSAAVKASLGKEDIWGVVRQSASKVAPCIKNARSRNEIPAGKYTFVLDWTIRPDGAVVDAHLKGPPEVLSTSLAACFASAMVTWRFPASQAGAPIANFPFGPVNVP